MFSLVGNYFYVMACVANSGPANTGRMVGELCGGNARIAPTRVGQVLSGLFIDNKQYAWAAVFSNVLTVELTTDGSYEEKGFVAEYYSR